MKTENKILLKRLNFLFCTPEERAFKRENLTDQNKLKISSLKDKYNGKRCFILGSSPSLNLLDLSKLNNEFVFTVNRGYMLKEKGLLHSSFHVISDTNTFKDTNSKFEELVNFSDKIFCYAGMQPPIKMDTYYFDYIQYQLNKEYSFQNDLLNPLIGYQSVIHFAIQIAYYLGFKEIYLLGVDLDFAQNKGHIYQETNEEVKRQFEHSIKEAKTMLYGLEKCEEYLKSQNIRLLNASPSGIVDCINRVKYEILFKEGKQ